MNEIDILDIFYDELRMKGESRDVLFLSVDETFVAKLKFKFNTNVQLDDVHKLVDICIANEWIERTTADPHYNYLSLTEAGLQMAIAARYSRIK